jgi:ADP-ribose pyrophosphatase YjhB (NUDIX family)
MNDPETLRIAVALVMSESRRILLAWNHHWQGFALPMTKIDAGPPAETPELAAARAAAETLQLPARVVPGRSGQAMRMLQLSGRDGEIKNYVYTVVPIEVHPDFHAAPRDHRPTIWAPVAKLAAGEYQPLTSSVQPVLDACREWGWL